MGFFKIYYPLIKFKYKQPVFYVYIILLIFLRIKDFILSHEISVIIFSNIFHIFSNS